MEDNRSVRKKPALSEDKPKKLVELTSEMEVEPDRGGKIYDLTETPDGPVQAPAPPKPAQPTASASQRPAAPKKEPRPQTRQKPGTRPQPPTEIENEVDAAFEAIEPYTPIDMSQDREEPKPARDKVEQLKKMAGDVLSESPAATRKKPGSDTPREPLQDTPPRRDTPRSGKQKPEPQTPGRKVDSGGGIIDLVNIVSPRQGDATRSEAPGGMMADDDDEEIIDLVDIVWKKPDSREAAGAEDLIDLTDRVIPPGKAASGGSGKDRDPDRRAATTTRQDKKASPGEQVIQLTDVLNSALKKSGGKSRADLSAPGRESPAGLAEEAIEAAVERYIRHKYNGDIERLIAAVVEKAVAREIESLKRNFMDENEDPE